MAANADRLPQRVIQAVQRGDNNSASLYAAEYARALQISGRDTEARAIFEVAAEFLQRQTGADPVEVKITNLEESNCKKVEVIFKTRTKEFIVCPETNDEAAKDTYYSALAEIKIGASSVSSSAESNSAGLLQRIGYLYLLADNISKAKEFFQRSIVKAEEEYLQATDDIFRADAFRIKAEDLFFTGNYVQAASVALKVKELIGASSPIVEALIAYPEGGNRFSVALKELEKYVNETYDKDREVYQDLTILEIMRSRK